MDAQIIISSLTSITSVAVSAIFTWQPIWFIFLVNACWDGKLCFRSRKIWHACSCYFGLICKILDFINFLKQNLLPQLIVVNDKHPSRVRLAFHRVWGSRRRSQVSVWGSVCLLTPPGWETGGYSNCRSWFVEVFLNRGTLWARWSMIINRSGHLRHKLTGAGSNKLVSRLIIFISVHQLTRRLICSYCSIACRKLSVCSHLVQL